MAFKIAGSMAIKEAVMKAGPVLLEPMMKVEVEVLKTSLGCDGRPHPAVVKLKGWVRVKSDCQSPIGGDVWLCHRYPLQDSRWGIFTMEFSTYDEVPRNVAEAIIAKSKGKA